jgi:hypothetical protein
VLPFRGENIAKLRHRAGTGNWGAFPYIGMSLEDVMSIAKTWSTFVAGVERPWLCWNVDDEWCLVQQRLVRSVGWVPIVGYDPRVGPPKATVPEAIVINFNKGFDLPVLYPHFPMEFVFLWCDRLAFWHSDLLVRPAKMQELAKKFAAMPDGMTAVTSQWNNPVTPPWAKWPPWKDWRQLFSKFKRSWELVGCTTRDASRSQFENGCGWWKWFWHHPRCPSEAARTERAKYHYDHGGGVFYWYKNCGGKVLVIDEAEIREGHCTSIGNKNFVHSGAVHHDVQRRIGVDLRSNFELAQVCERLEIAELLAPVT